MTGKKGVTLFLLLAVVVILAGVYYGLSKVDFSDDKDKTDKTTIVSLDTKKITNISYQVDQTTMELTKKDGTWYLANDESFPVEQSTVEAMLSELSDVTADRTMESDDLESYGLTQPQNTIVIKDSDGNTNTIKVGSQNATTSDYYVMVNDDSKIYTVLSSIPGAFTKTQDELKQAEETTEGTQATTATDTTATE